MPPFRILSKLCIGRQLILTATCAYDGLVTFCFHLTLESWKTLCCQKAPVLLASIISQQKKENMSSGIIKAPLLCIVINSPFMEKTLTTFWWWWLLLLLLFCAGHFTNQWWSKPRVRALSNLPEAFSSFSSSDTWGHHNMDRSWLWAQWLWFWWQYFDHSPCPTQEVPRLCGCF